MSSLRAETAHPSIERATGPQSWAQLQQELTATKEKLRSAYERIHTLEANVTHLQAENARYRQRDAEQRNILATTALPAGAKVSMLGVLRHLEKDDLPTDNQGRKRICLKTLSHQLGQSDEAIGRHVATFEQLGLIDKHAVKSVAPDGMPTTTLHVAPIPEKIRALPTMTRQEAGNKWGGLRCPACNSAHVKITRKITCLDCGNVAIDEKILGEHDHQPDDPGPGGKPEPQDAVSGEAPDTPLDDAPVSVAPEPQDAALINQQYPTVPQDAAQVTLDDAEQTERPALTPIPVTWDDERLKQEAAMLFQWLSDSPVHIAMPPTGLNKYIEIKKPLTLEDALDHLSGCQARGLKKRPDAQYTRALIFDADGDKPSDVEALRNGGAKLANAGYLPLWDASPAVDHHAGGGHLVILFNRLVNTGAAYQEVYRLAPELAAIEEHWPHARNMRLPGAFYQRPAGEKAGRTWQAVADWCTLTDLVTGDAAKHGPDLWRLLLSHQTDARLIPDAPAVAPAPKPAPKVKALDVPSGEVDSVWLAKYGDGNGFRVRFTVKQLIDAFNATHTCDDIHPRGKHGMALAIWRGEHDGSVQYNDDGTWHDYGNHGDYPNHGDAFALWCLVKGITKADALSELGRQAARGYLPVSSSQQSA